MKSLIKELRQDLSSKEVPTGLESKFEKGPSSESELLSSAADNPEFRDIFQIAVDLDATLFPIDRAIEEMGIDFQSRNIVSWNNGGDCLGDMLVAHFQRPELSYDNDLTPEQEKEKGEIFLRFFEKIHEDAEIMKRAGVYQYAPEILLDLQKRGVKIHILTHRSAEAEDETLEWLSHMDVPHDFFVCDSTKNLDKIDYCLENGVPIILDDKPETIKGAEAAGIEAISLAWPYSKKALQEAGGDEASCWLEMEHHVLFHIESLVHKRAEEFSLKMPKPSLVEKENDLWPRAH